MSDFNLGAALAAYKRDSEITVLQPGTYTLEVTSAKGKPGQKGPQIVPVFKVYAGPLAGQRVMAGSLSFSEGALWKTFPALKGFGITEQQIEQANSQPDPIQVLADALVGRVADVTVSVDQWKGEDRNKIDSVAPADLGGVSAPPPVAVADVAPPAAPVAEAAPAPAPPAPTTAAPAPSF